MELLTQKNISQKTNSSTQKNDIKRLTYRPSQQLLLPLINNGLDAKNKDFDR